MAWIPSHQELARHPKTRRFARILNIGLPAAIGHLHLLWWWSLDYASDGRIDRYEPEDIADAMLWQGDAQALIDALVSAGFVDRREDGLWLHDWDHYGGALNRRREYNRERQRRSREASETDVAASDVSRVSHALVTRDSDVTNALVTDASRVSHGAREEKSREEKSRETNASHSSLQPAAATAPDSRASAKIFGEDTEEYALAMLLREKILSNNPRAKVPGPSPGALARWCREFDLMIRADKRSPPEIRDVIRWCQADSFWRANILSAKKLREKFDTLWLQMRRNGEVKRGRSDIDQRRAELKLRYADAARLAVAVPEVRQT